VTLLGQRWSLGARIGDVSGFGQVFLATADDGTEGVVKLVPKEPGADRELLFENLAGTPNVVPIIDKGETRTHWALVMPRAERSLRAELQASGGLLTVSSAVPVLIDIATALAALEGQVVHRDLKPENVLLLDGSWCLADFGIARYAEATTSANTWKDAWSAPYAAPERWRHERATKATDVYSLGVMAHEMLAGDLPFGGPDTADFRDQHLHRDAPVLAMAPASLAGLVTECLFKDPGARPTAANVLVRLGRMSEPPSPGAAALQAANAAAQAAAAVEQGRISAATSDGERREALLAAARQTFGVIGTRLRQAVTDNASAATADPKSTPEDWSFSLGAASFGVDPPKKTAPMPWGNATWAPAFTVIAHAAIGVSFEADPYGYRGRTHSLWYCDAQQEGVFRWFETAFMVMPMINKRFAQEPFQFEPSESAGKALWNGVAEWQVAWPFTPIDQGDDVDFVERWITWFGLAADRKLHHPSSMPERQPEGSWRR
jgi:hypothetical protein